MKRNANETIAVALSGGADSLFTLVLLQEVGYEVTALHGLFKESDQGKEKTVAAIGQLCARLGVPLHVADLRQEFDEKVVEPFVRGWLSGRTPNPCALCNPRVKFGLLLEAAENAGAERIATGHYARLTDHPDFGQALMRGVDQTREQSYFLSLVPRQRLARARLPLGEWRKEEVKAELARRGLTPPLPSESREICFVPDDDYRAFLQNRNLELPGPGPILNAEGTVLGRHQGLWRYTQGQRRGLHIAFSEPLYVLGKDAERNALLVGTKQEFQSQTCLVEQVNLLVAVELWPETVLAQIRYRQQATPARAKWEDGRLRLAFEEPQPPPPPGQIAALYSEDGTVLAAGVITEELKNASGGREE